MEWGSHGLDSVFCQRSNLCSPRFLRMMADMARAKPLPPLLSFPCGTPGRARRRASAFTVSAPACSRTHGCAAPCLATTHVVVVAGPLQPQGQAGAAGPAVFPWREPPDVPRQRLVRTRDRPPPPSGCARAARTGARTLVRQPPVAKGKRRARLSPLAVVTARRRVARWRCTLQFRKGAPSEKQELVSFLSPLPGTPRLSAATTCCPCARPSGACPIRSACSSPSLPSWPSSTTTICSTLWRGRSGASSRTAARSTSSAS